MIDIKLDKQSMNDLQEALKDRPYQILKRTAIAINKTAKKHKTQAATKVRETLNINAKTAKDAIRIAKRRATAKHLTATIYINQTPDLGLDKFQARQTKRGVSYKIETGGTKTFVEGAFIVKRYNKNVFKRKYPYLPKKAGGNKSQNKRLGLMLGTTVMKAYKRHKLLKWSQKTVTNELKFQIQQQVKYVLQKKV